MTREAKIGMLTGLGVIVLIGVLLSEYLGGGGAGMGGMSPTGRMAELPLGAAYRQEVMQPVGVPGMARSDGGGESAGVTPAGPIAAGSPTMPEVAKGSAEGVAGPSIGQAVAAVPAGMVQTASPGETNVPTLQLAEATEGQEAVYVAGQPKAVKGVGLAFVDTGPAAVKGQEYVIAPGDTLGKIAAKFYKSSKGAAVQRIVAANPKVLKNDKTMLIAGRKLIIPAAAAPALATAKAETPAVAGNTKGRKAAVLIHQPGGTAVADMPGEGSGKLTAPAKSAERVVVVQSGDTLEKIAKKLAPGNVSAMVKKLEAANGIKDPKAMKAGMKLKVPAA